MSRIYDVVIIGGGPAGIYSAKALSNRGKSVALVEKNRLGGTALVSGALPVKKILDSFKNNKRKKEHIRKELLNNWDNELEILYKKIEKDIKSEGIHIYYGDGAFIDDKTFKVNEDCLQGKYFIIATGTRPASTKDFQIDHSHVITHIEAINLKDMPNVVTILGGNVEGVELAALYSEMGAKVTLIEMEEEILAGNDEDLVEPIKNHLMSMGVEIITGVKAKGLEIEENATKVILQGGEKISCDKAITTLFRKPNFPQGIEKTNIQIEEEKIIVNENLQTHENHIFAIGDINGMLGMAHVAIHQGLAVADYILDGKRLDLDYEIFPRAVFTIPEMAGVGYQEVELESTNISYKVGTCRFEDTWRGWANNAVGFTKVILDSNDVLLGIWMIGENVSESIGLLGLAIKEKRTADEILSNLVIHPSLTESILEATIQGKEKV